MCFTPYMKTVFIIEMSNPRGKADSTARPPLYATIDTMATTFYHFQRPAVKHRDTPPADPGAIADS